MDRTAALVDAAPLSFWLDDPSAPDPLPPLTGWTTADLVIVGGGYTGLWTALLAKSASPDRDIVLLEADRCGWGASGRNGGFCSASLTHGRNNGLERFPDEFDQLDRLGRWNLDEIERTIGEHSIDCDFERTGELSVATEPWQVDGLRHERELAERHGLTPEFLDGEAMRAEVHSPTYLAGLWDAEGCALVHPAKLAWGLRRAAEALGVRIYEHTPVDAVVDADGVGVLGGTGRTTGGGHRAGGAGGVVLRTAHGAVRCDRAAVGTNAYPSPVKRLRKYIVPVYDYVLMTEPLTEAQQAAIGWERRQGLGGCGNQFLYYRRTAENRILFGGYDAIYHYGGAIRPSLEQRDETFLKLATLFSETFPQLEDVRFTHAWAGAIDTCSRFCAFFDLSHRDRVASAAGYTGLGVGASRFAAQVMLDLLAGQETERTTLEFVTKKPLPFPPEPLRFAGIALTKWSMEQADRHAGRRNLWLRALDRVGMGFDS